MNLRLDKETFMVLVEILKRYIDRETTGMRPSIPVHERVAMALWRYGSGDSSRTISWLFGVGESTCADIYLEVAQAICDEFGPECLSTPTHEEMKRQAYRFENGRGFPMCVGARDGTHIPVRGASGRGELLWCFRGFYSVVLQIVAGADYGILAATMGHAGNAHDATSMRKHVFWQKREEIVPQGTRNIEGIQVLYIEIGDSALPLKRSMKPYMHNKLTDAEAY